VERFGPGGPGGGPGNKRNLKQVVQCAAQSADNFDIAFLLGVEDKPGGEFLFGSAIGPAVMFLTDPNASTAQDAASGVSSVVLTQTNLPERAVGAVSRAHVDSGFQFLFSRIPATSFGATPIGKAFTTAGGAVAKGLGTLGKLPIVWFDASVFTFSLFLCGE
jgi:hypothetical protein